MKTKGFSTLETVLVLCIVTVIAGLGWFMYQRRDVRPKTLDAVLSQITIDSKRAFTNTSFEPKSNWSAEAEATGFNKVDGYEYSVSGVGRGVSLIYENSDKTATQKHFFFFKKTIPPAKNLGEVKEFVGNRLVKYGFTTSDNKTYQRGDDKCTVLNDPVELQHPDATYESNLLDVSCFGKEILADTASEMKSFVDEYLKANPGVKASDLSVGPLTIKSRNGAGVISSSHEAGYDIAELVVSTKASKKIALYYSKDNTWHYVTQANDEFGFECGPMKANPDARKALYNQVCLSENGQVRLDTNNRALQ